MGMYFVLSEEMIKEGMPPLLRIFIWPTNVTKEQGRFQKDRNCVQAPTLGRPSLLFIKIPIPLLLFKDRELQLSKTSTFGKTYLDNPIRIRNKPVHPIAPS